jgi:ribosomal protein S18 acetylase RimI-like enzyme
MSALTGPHAHLAERCGRALRYPADACPFVGLPLEPDKAAWDDLAELVGTGAVAATAGVRSAPPHGWEVLMDLDCVQMVDDGVSVGVDAEAEPLRRADVPDMLALVKRTRPGPFLPRTIDLGRYLGIRRDGELIAMAGERLHPTGWTEISAVCTDERFRGQGLGTRLVQAVAAGIRERGEIPFLHAAASNAGAIRLYESMGFRHRRRARFIVARAPGRRPEGLTIAIRAAAVSAAAAALMTARPSRSLGGCRR